jgi:hypothetical protein
LQFIGDFCFQRKWLNKQGGFYYLPLAWGSDNISAYIGASLNGVANTNKVVFLYRVNSQTITSTSNTETKMKATELENKWILDFLSTPCNSLEDELYRKQLLSEMPRIIRKKKALAVTSDIKRKRGVTRYFFWLTHKKEYGLNAKELLYAFIKSLL